MFIKESRKAPIYPLFILSRWEKGSPGITHCGIAWSYIIDMLNTLKSTVQVAYSLGSVWMLILEGMALNW